MAEHSDSDVIEIGTPSKPTLTLLEDNTVEVKWITPKASGTDVQEFEIAYKESSKRHYRTVNHKGGENKVLIPRLKQNTNYHFKLRALNFDDDVISEWSDEADILIDRNIYDNQCSSDEEEYYDPLVESITSDDEKDVFDIDNLKVREPVCNEILYDGTRESAETDVENQQIASNEEDDFSVDETIPSQPICTEKNGSHSLTLLWQKPSAYQKKIDYFEVFYKEGTSDPKNVRTKDDSIIYKLTNLKQNSSYKFRVRAVTKTDYLDDPGSLSEESEPTTTNVSIASYLIEDESTEEIRKDVYTNMIIYKLKCFDEGENDTQNKIRHILVGRGRDLGDGGDKRYVLLFGKAGAGKTTLIDLMVNHVYDVGWEDSFRLTAIDKMSDEKNRDESLSQTQWITFYEMRRKENSMLPFDLVIIDTPGFEMENAAAIDKTRQQFKALFSSGRFPGVHAVCVVSQSHTGRLTKTESNLCEIMVELFGTDIERNVFIFATCADSTEPMLRRFFNKIRFEYHACFKFNNTPFTIEHQMSRSSEQQNDWEKGKNEIFNFFNILNDTHLSSFEMFRENAIECEKIRKKYDAKRGEIKSACCDLISILNKKVHYEKIKVRHAAGNYSTICNKCRKTCCTPCTASWVNKRLCWSIYFFSGTCVACPDTCKVSDHEYGILSYHQAPRIDSKQAGTNTFDRNILSLESKRIKEGGLQISELFRRATELQNELHKRTNLGVRYSNEDMIDSFIQEMTSTQSLHWELFAAIFKKCKAELRKPTQDRWKTLDDLLTNDEK